MESFPGLGLAHDASDAVIWRARQREGLVLITANRNRHGPDSLEAVIQAENRPHSLPVVTIGDANRLLKDRLYAEQAAVRLLERLLAIEDFRGTGRIFTSRDDKLPGESGRSRPRGPGRAARRIGAFPTPAPGPAAAATRRRSPRRPAEESPDPGRGQSDRVPVQSPSNPHPTLRPNGSHSPYGAAEWYDARSGRT